MATLSVLSYNLPQGLIMKASGNGNATPLPTANNNSSTTGNSNATSLSKTFNKITVQNVLSENNGNCINISNNSGSSSNVNTIVRKIKDFGMFGMVNNAVGNTSITTSSGITVTARKRPLTETKSKNDNKPAVIVTKKVKLSKEPATPKSCKKSNENIASKQKTPTSTPTTSITLAIPKPAGTPGRKGLPLPQAVARRNARERNRVKQVNNGFALLRERIPEEVAETFESQGAGRGAVKKLSKVETLRMAVEYIRSLERLLGFNFPIGGGGGGGGASDRSILGSPSGDDDSFSIIKDEFDALSPGMDETYDDSLSNYDVDEYFGGVQSNNNSITQPSYVEPPMTQPPLNQFDLLPSITTLNGLQYIRIPGTNTYQLLTPDIFIGNSNSPPNSSIDDEQFNALVDTNCPSPAASSSTVDLHSSPPSIINMTTTNAATAPATPSTAATTTTTSSGTFVNQASSTLSQSPVPLTSSPSASSSLHHLQQQSMQPTMLSPAANELLLQTSAAVDRLSDNRRFVAPTPPQQQHQQHQPQQQHLQLPRMMIKQEYNDTDFVSSTPSPTAASLSSTTLIYQTPPAIHDQQQFLLGHAPISLSMSPPLDHCNVTTQGVRTATMPSAGLQSFYDHNGSFYEGVVTFKKERNDVLLDTSTTTAGLSDESMMEAIDWWEAHTPKSDGGSVML